MSDTPMRCADAAAYLPAFADDELAEPLRAQVAAHVAGCAACAAEVHRHQEIRTLVASLPRSAPSLEVLDRVLAAGRFAGPSGFVRESLRGRRRRLVRRALPAFLQAASGPTSMRPLDRRPRPQTVAFRALPALAAALLIALSVVAFSHFPLATRFGARSPSPAPQSLANVLLATQRAVDAHRGALAFAPAVPTYLPAGAALRGVTVGSEPAAATRRYLDITWNIVLPASTLHLRESPLPLAARGDFLPLGAGDPLLTWSLGTHQWSAGIAQTPDRRCAIGEDRQDYSLVVDVGMQSPDRPCDDPDNAKAINVLRLASLSLDAPYLPLSVLPPDPAASVLHVRAMRVPGGGPTWEVYADPAHHRTSITARDARGRVVYVDHINDNGDVTRLDPAARTIATLAGGVGALGEPVALPVDVMAFLNNANAFLGAGELWNLGPDPADPAHRARLALVGAPYPTTLLVDTSSRRVIGALVDYGAAGRPGGPDASSRLTPADGCPAFAAIDFLAPDSIPAAVFDASTAGYTPGRVPATIGC